MINHLLIILLVIANSTHHFFALNYSRSSISQDYIPLYYPKLQTLMITNPCNTDQSILIQNHSLYKFDREQSQWKQLYISQKIFPNQIPMVNSIAHLDKDLILIINGTLFRTQDIISSSINKELIYRLLRYTNVPILSGRMDYVFTTPCCTCLKMTSTRPMSQALNDYVILADKYGNVILFYLKSLTVIYDFGNIFQSQSICQTNSCTILHLGLIHSLPILICIIQYHTEQAILFHQSFLDLNSTSHQKSTFIHFTGDTLHITPSTIPNAYFFWDEKQIFYTSNAGQILSEIIPHGCQIDYLNNMNEDQLKTYYTNLHIDYDNITLLTKEIYCFNFTIDYLFISNKEFFIFTKNNEWLYGKESLFPSMINLTPTCARNPSLPQIDAQCLANMNNQSFPCSSFCLYTRFEPLFDVNEIYILEKKMKKSWKFLLESYTIIPIMISCIKSNLLNYSIDYTIDRLNNGLIRTIGNILISTTNQTNNELLGSSLISLRVGLIQYGYSCTQPSSFSLQIEASCSTKSSLRVEKDNEFNYWNDSNSLQDIEWIRQNLPPNLLRQFSPISLKHKSTDPIVLKYQHCFNHTCQSIDYTQFDSFLIYAIPLNNKHEDYAHYLINRTDSCVPFSRLIYRLWMRWTLNRTQLLQISYERRTFYRTLLNLLSITNKSCLFFNGSNPIQINQTINQASEDYLKFILHIIAYNPPFSFCELETLLLIEIEPLHNLHNSYRGFIFFFTLLLFLVFLIVFIHIYTYYKNQQREKSLEYHRLNQIDAGQFHQWYDIARYLNQHKNTPNYHSIQNYLSNLQPTASLIEQ